ITQPAGADAEAQPAHSLALAASAARAATFVVLAMTFVLIAWGQWAIDHEQAPFDWPFTRWLEHRWTWDFRRPNALAFGVPLFVAGGLVFAALAPRGLPRFLPSSASLSLPLRARIVVALLVVPLVIWAWLNLRLYNGHYEPAYRWLFFLSVLAMLAGVVAIDVMRGVYGRLRLAWSHAAEALAVFAITGTFIGINARDLNNWRYSTIGDDGEFYVWAKRIGDQPDINWFSQSGPFGYHPVLSSAWQALSIRVFGDSLFGWKMASLLAIALTLPLFYWLLRELFSVRVAVFGTLFLGASHYLFAYAHTGYDNILAIFPAVGCLALLAAGVRRGSMAFLFASGLFAGMGFYTFYSSRSAIMIAGVAALALTWQRFDAGSLRRQATSIGVLVAGFIVFALPIFATNQWEVIDATLGEGTDKANYPFWKLVGENISRSLLGWTYNPADHHYVAGSLLDSLTVVFTVAGFFFALTRVRRAPFFMVLMWFAVAVVVSGVLSPYGVVVISRMHYALPPLAAFAGIAVDRLLSAAEDVYPTRSGAWVATLAAIAVLAPLLFISNGRHFFLYSAHRNPTPNDTIIARELSASQCRDGALRSVAYHNAPGQTMDFNWPFFDMKHRKPLQLNYAHLSQVYNAYPSTGGVGCVVLPNLDPADWIEGAEDIRRVQAAMQEGASSPGDFQVVSDLTGSANRRVGVSLREGKGVAAADLSGVWRTDLSRGDGLEGIVKGQERDFFAALDDPTMKPAREVSLFHEEPVLVVEDGESVRGYPLRYVIWRGIVNDTIGGEPVAVTYDPIAGSARVFSRTLPGRTVTFSITGLLRDGNALLYDRETETWWQQLTGVAVTGELAGTRLEARSARVVPWKDYALAYPDAPTLAIESSAFEGTTNPYIGYEVRDGRPIFTLAAIDDRLRPMDRVAVIESNGERVAVPFPDGGPKMNMVLPITVSGTPVVIFFDWRAWSLLDSQNYRDSRPIGTMTAYAPHVAGSPETETFEASGADAFTERRTGSVWDTL
ncbi:MAG: DUF3179 domain-containing (seleno)protein, partial [Dehalococcoidia bacterium]